MESGPFYNNSDFDRIYAPNAEYHDLFIIARGRAAVRYSFQLIARFWALQLDDMGDPRIISTRGANVTQKEHTRTTSTIIVRIPYQISQHFKLVPLVRSQYKGWVDLHLQNNIDNPSGSFVIVRHDDRMVLGEDQDALSTVLATPVVGSGLQWVRRVHGRMVEYWAPKEDQ